MLPSSQRERRVSRLNRTGNNTTGWARRLTALLVTACLVMAMALPVYAEEDLLPDAPGEVELLEDEQGTASGEDTVPPEQNAATPVPDAATPEPEQSAEPEQPAPTETPEPTAEPTPTPEPAATATATPVPTVTPTATPEPTEQPQKMYAAKSVDNVQAASEGGVPDTYTLYFAVPTKWKDYTKVKIYAVDGKDSNTYHKYFLDMLEVGETKDQRKIYSVVLDHQKHYQYGGLNGLEFRGYNGDAIADENPAYKVVIAQVDNNNNPPWMTFNSGDHYIGGNYYDGNKNKGDGWNRDDWTTYTVGHKLFAGEKMAFENKTRETLTNVKAWFYELDEETGKLNPIGGPISLNSDGLDSGIASGSTATFDIPNDFCSFVRFTAGDDDTGISEYYNFYNEEVKGENQKRFQYSEGQCYCYMYNGNDDATWGRPGAIRIYYDATFSKLPTTGANDTGGDYSIPKAKKETIYYRIKGDGAESESGTLVKDGTNKNLYYIDIPQGYSSIIFSGEKIDGDEETKRHGLSTEWLPIPTDDKNCFYADTNDDAVYKDTTRGGYWAPKGTLRDAETWKNTDTTDTTKTKVVDIASVPFTEEANTKYVTSTLYDYYTDYELNGKNRDKYGKYTDASHRTWVTFREFDQALSDYYQAAKAPYPLYTGHFQPDNGHEFSQIADTLNLFGYSNFNRFMAINNSQRNEDYSSGSDHTYYAYQGLVADKTSTGNADGAPLLNGTEKATVEPHFNKDFLLGENSKNAKLGEVYENVKFPFTKVKSLFDNEQDVDYWCFDSKDTTLYLKQDSGQNSDSKYFLQRTDNRESSKNVSASQGSKDPYGYFPFNETADPGVASTYNYGFGTKLQMDFTLTDDGMVETEKTNGEKVKTNIKFFFSGDDDVWVFIDGQLALDVGGAHGEVSGLLEFSETRDGKNSVTAYVSKVKKNGTLDSDKDGNPVKAVKYKGEDINFCAQGTTLTFDKGQKHTLTMYYMERGMWESNMAVAFNFPDHNELQVEKQVDVSDVNPLFQESFKNQKIFTFNIQNLATHYEAKATDEPAIETYKLPDTVYSSATGLLSYESSLPEGVGTGSAVLWSSDKSDPSSLYRDQRRGTLTLDSAINISPYSYLTFDVYVQGKQTDTCALSNLYVELWDTSGKQMGCLGTKGLQSSDVYGAATALHPGTWYSVRLMLNSLKQVEGFDKTQLKSITVGDNYARSIYLRNFTFSSAPTLPKQTGFTTAQYNVPDYGSAESGKLENAAYAVFSSNLGNGDVVDENGRFLLQDGETVTFNDQFRRGSYIALQEQIDTELYDTTWTVYENDVPVTNVSGKADVVTTGSVSTLQNISGTAPNDGRTEKAVDATLDGHNTKNEYTEAKKPSTALVFRSYSNSADDNELTKLKVVFNNKVKTGKLIIRKVPAEGETLEGKTFTFTVRFGDVGGQSLGNIIPPKEYTCTVEKHGDEYYGEIVIDKIPVGTRFVVWENEQTGTSLKSVSFKGGKGCAVAADGVKVYGAIAEGEANAATATFENTARELIDITVKKEWKKQDGTTDIPQVDLPDAIYLQLQRTETPDEADSWQKVSGYESVELKKPDSYEGWTKQFTGLDKYDASKTGQDRKPYTYRVLESATKTGQFYGGAAGDVIEISGKKYKVLNTTRVTGDSTNKTLTLTNQLQDAKYNLVITKQDAQDNSIKLGGVEFKLEKLNDSGAAETTYNGVTGSDSTNQGKCSFASLTPGSYRLTETKTAEGYTLLSEAIEFELTVNGECKRNGTNYGTVTPDTSGVYNIALTVYNRKGFTLPHTGADAPSLWLLIGLPALVAVLLVLVFRYNKKGGRRS